MLLTAVGLYWTVAYRVAQKQREIGIRLAPGAGFRHILGVVAVDCLSLVCAGLAIGPAASAGLSRLLRGLLYGMAPEDPTTFVSVVALLILVATFATWPPARHAKRVDPVLVLRQS
jgi:putative ABC transport system permease protein